MFYAENARFAVEELKQLRREEQRRSPFVGHHKDQWQFQKYVLCQADQDDQAHCDDWLAKTC